ncbi:MAG: hypothetical protein RSC76_09835 [Oscillospiraceae bacterium]
MKAKSFHCSKNGLAAQIAAEIGTKLQCVSDKMPPAYPSDAEKVVYIGIEMDGKVPLPVEQFCKDLNPARTKNVAFYIINGKGNTQGLEAVIANLKKNGVNTIPEILPITVKTSLFNKGKLTDADIKKALDWAVKISLMP